MGDDLRIEFRERRASLDGRELSLRSKSFDLLAVLASRPQHLFHRGMLIDRVWQGRSVSPDVLTGCIREIRRALADDPKNPKWVQTVSGAGYRLLRTPVTIATCDVADAPAARPKERHTPISARRASIAVLIFTHPDPHQSALSLAMSRDISVGLARTRWIRVAASASVERLGPGASANQIAEALSVRYLLEGDVRRVQNGLALQVTLSEVGADHILWADRVERPGDDAASLMDDICAVVVSAVESEIETSERRKAVLAPVRGQDAWFGFHRGMSLLQRQDPRSLVSVERVLYDASRADPTCARVAAARSWYHWQRLFFGANADRNGILDRARDHALESQALDPRDPLGHWALGRVHWLAGDLESAADNLTRAVTLNPSFAVGHYSLGYTQYLLGQEEMAMASCDNAINLSPLDPLAFAFHCIKAHVLCFKGEAQQALYHARRVADHPNAHAFALVVAAWVNELCGNRKIAQECLTRIQSRWPDYRRSDYMKALFHQTPWYPKDRRRAIENAFDKLGFT